MLNQVNSNIKENFFKSINIRLDTDHPERFAHFHPTAKNTRIIKAIVSGDPSPTSMIVAAYGSGKSLAAGVAAMLIENDRQADDVISAITVRIASVDRKLGNFLAERVELNSQGMSIFLEGHEPHVSDEIFRQSKKRFPSLRHPRNHARNTINMLEAVWRRAASENLDRLTILWDEFGRHLEALADLADTKELLLVQQISEWSSRKNSPSVTFGLIMHQNFLNYADDLSQSMRESWKKIEGRFNTIHCVEDSKEMYQLIASIVSQLRNREREGGGVRRPPAFDSQAENALKLGLFEAFEDKNALAQVFADSYPLHPAALYSLPRLAARLAQNERTIFSFIRDCTLDKPATLANLYKYFSDSMSTDTGIGGTHRRWLETQSALSKVDSDMEKEILSSVAVLGFGVSGERSRVKKALVEFAVSDIQKTSRSDVRKSIESLIERKLLLYRRRNDDVSVWHGTDIDIRSILKEEITRIRAELEPIEVLSKEHPAPNWRPVAHNIRNAVRRFFEGRYVPANELFQKELLHSLLSLAPGEDGRIIYCIAETQKEISDLLSLIPSISSPDHGVLFVIPMYPLRVTEIALEIAALERLQLNSDVVASDPFVLPELRHMTDSAREDLARSMRYFTHPGRNGGRWFSGRELLALKDDRQLYEKLSKISDKRFPSTPRINNELIVRKNISRPIVNARKKLILGILERSGEPHLGYKREATTPDVAIYRTVLEQTGLYHSQKNTWKWSDPNQLKDENLAQVWRVLQQFFETAGMRKSPSEQIFDKFELPPYGMRRGLIPILVAAALKAFARAVVIKRQGKYLPDILASEIEDLCSSPEKFTVDVLETDPPLCRYLSELSEQFDGRQSVVDDDLIRQFHDSLEFWKAQLPDQALKTRYVSDGAKEFQRVLRKETDPAVIALKEFPRLAGVKRAAADTSEFIGKLRREIEGIVDGYAAKAISAANNVFDIGNGEKQDILQKAKSWSMCFDEKAFTPSELDNKCRAVLVRASEANEGRYTESSFVLSLSSILLGYGFDKWKDSTVREFAERLTETVKKLEQLALETPRPSKSFLPLVERNFHRLYKQLQSMIGSENAREKIGELLREKEHCRQNPSRGVKENGTYEKSA